MQNMLFLLKKAMQLDVFNQKNPQELPLAAKLRPKNLDEFIGQVKIRASLEKLILNPRHVIFWGPPGAGKTSLVHVLASKMGLELHSFSAVTGGIPELKRLIEEVLQNQRAFKKKVILFIDEIHRFNKSQQDLLLPYLENGDFIFFGATTEYPHTTLNRALISRVSLVELQKLTSENLVQILGIGIKDLNRPDLSEYLEDLSKLSNGDARFALNQLSILSTFQSSELENKEDCLKILFEHARLYDKNGNRHHDVISAFIKSIRGSDPDAALLYLGIMLDGGEDPEFIARRLIILASEDIGLANSQALQVAVNTHYAVKQIGMPEGRITLSHAVVFMALSPKSNSVYKGIDGAVDFVKKNPTLEVPGHLSNVSPDKKNYQYPHSYSGNWVQQDYLPKNVKESFYVPSSNGSEKVLVEQWKNKTKNF